MLTQPTQRSVLYDSTERNDFADTTYNYSQIYSVELVSTSFRTDVHIYIYIYMTTLYI